MKKFTQIFLFFTLLSVGPVMSMNLSDSAALYYEKGEFAKSVNCYEKILAEGKDSWILYYNLGNAYYKNKNLGNAILNYEKAKKLNPTNQDLLNNLQIAESKVVDKIEHRQIYIEDELRDFFIYRLSTTGWAWLSVATLVIMLVFFFMFYAGRRPGVKRFAFWSGLVFTISFILSLTFGFMALNEKNSKMHGVITAATVNIYNSPRADDSNKQTYTLNEGTRLKILDIDQEWANIQLANGNEGWVKASDLGVY